MRSRLVLWLSLSVVFVASFLWWRHAGPRPAAARLVAKTVDQPGRASTRPQAPAASPVQPIHLLSGLPGALNTPVFPTPAEAKTNRFAYRLANTHQTVSQLARNPRGILLQNALLDTAQSTALPIPDFLRAQGDPGSYIVQSRQPLDDAFRTALKLAGATIVAYIPNNAYLVRASAATAQQLANNDLTSSVLPYEPYYKFNPSLLKLAVEQTPLPENNNLNLLLFPGTRDTTLNDLKDLGAAVLAEETSPFGPTLRIQAPTNSLPALAGLPGIQELELVHARVPANDLSRERLLVALDSVAPTNYMYLTGSNVLVNVNDTGVDTNHPDLQGRVFLDAADTTGAGGRDNNGHGTHVAGIIASSGGQSTTVSNAYGSIMPPVDGQFRGEAPGAKIFSMPWTWLDSDLQQKAASSNAFIMNNGWTYGVSGYDLAAASYDAAVRDALPLVPGSQPLLVVFPAGNGGGAADDGSAGNADTIYSPGTAKNVITVGAVEQFRNITNDVWKCDPFGNCTTNQPWWGETDSSNQVAAFSSRGNVGIGTEGDFGRFKPDLVAPGTFVVSTRSTTWDEQAYYNPTSHIHYAFNKLVLGPGADFSNPEWIPYNAVAVSMRVSPNRDTTFPMPDLPIYISGTDYPTTNAGGFDFMRTNTVDMPPDGGATFNPTWVNNNLFFMVLNTSTQSVAFNLSFDITVTNDMGNYFEVLSNMNNQLGPYYRYESGSSMAAASVSGTLALMQEFFEQRQHVTNSPALMKALLINGARPLSAQYDFQVKNAINHQGWGLVQLTNSLPVSLTTNSSGTGSMLVFDQSPTNALATGMRHTRYVTVNTPISRTDPLRVTLVWTDPPGDPVAGVKLVNDLDLIVTNLDTGDVFYGNDIIGGNAYNVAWNTNMVPNIDAVNNVENVYLSPPIGTNYSITVVGHRVNVNAVTAHPDNVAQDYALVVSSGDGRFPDALTLTSEAPIVYTTTPWVDMMTNSFSSDPNRYGGLLTHQHVGANTPLLGTNTLALPNDANAQLTIGMTNQWHFYMISNAMRFTNAAFMTFLPPDLAVPRMGTTNVSNPDNATRVEADIDLYVSTNPGLTNLDPAVVEAAYKSVTRGGTESIILSNAVPGAVYYIGVKSEDHMAAEYSFMGVFTLLPIGSSDADGNQTLTWGPMPIPDGTPAHPGIVEIPLPCMDMLLRRVVVSNTINHQLMGDLQGTLTQLGTHRFAILNNHAPDVQVINSMYVYDDSDEGDISAPAGATLKPSDGPGSLHDFAGQRAGSVFEFTMIDNALNHVGTNEYITVFLEKQQPLTNGITITIPPHHCKEEFIEVPAGVTNLTVDFSFLSGTGPLGVQICPLGQTGGCVTNLITAPGGSVVHDIYDVPPLKAGTYSIKVCNLGDDAVTVHILAKLFYNTAPPISTSVDLPAPVTIKDDSVTYATIDFTNHLTISAMDIGLLISDPRISDLAITLISPNGTRVLLFENRGAGSTNGLGSFSLGTNGYTFPGNVATVPFYTNDFEQAAVGLYAPGAIFQGWNVLTNYVSVVPDLTYLWLSNNVLMLQDGVVSNSLPTTNANVYQLTYKVTHAPYLVGTVAWYPFDGNADDIFGGFNGLLSGDVQFNSTTGMVNQAYWGDGAATRMMVPGTKELDLGRSKYGFSIEGWINPNNVVTIASTNQSATAVWSQGFESVALSGDYVIYSAGSYFSEGWHVDAGDIDVGHYAAADSGSQFLDINGFHQGAISTNLPLVPGRSYTLSFAYARNPDSTSYGVVPQATVSLNGTNAVTLTGSPTNSWSNLQWAHASIPFTAGSPTTRLAIASLVTGPSGILLDSFQINAATLSTNQVPYPGPLVAWSDPSGTNGIVPGVQFYYGGLPGTNPPFVNLPGTLWVNVWDTNGLAHILAATNGVALTNGGWQHVAFTYDAGTRLGRLYTNGTLALAQVLTNAPMVPRTKGDLYFGFDPVDPLHFNTYKGGLDEFALYQRPLSDCEVGAIFRAGPAGKYNTNVLTCPVTNSVELFTSQGIVTASFTNGLAWVTNGPSWETNTVLFTNQLFTAITNGPGTNWTGLVVTGADFNVQVDDFVLSAVVTNSIDGMMHFTDNTNVALVPIKFAPWPYTLSNFPPTLIFSNDFESATGWVYQTSATLPGGTNDPAIGARDWTVLSGPVTLVTNGGFDLNGTNYLALSTGAVQCTLPTAGGHKYQLTYSLRGPAAVGWWNGEINWLSQRALDIIGGNHGAFLDHATNHVKALVGPHSLYFNGMDTNGLGSKVDLGDPANLRLTNAITIEGWIMPVVQTNYYGSEQIFFRGDLRNCLDPYFLALDPGIDPTRRNLRFHIEDAVSGNCGFELLSTNTPIHTGRWQHIAAVFEPNVIPPQPLPGGKFTAATNQLRLYLDGVCIASNYTAIRPFAELDPSYSPGVALGNRSRTDYSEPYRGYMDELTVYGRALTDPELAAIAAAQDAGKFDSAVPPAQSLAKLAVSLDGVTVDTAYGDNAQWTTHTVTFTAVQTNTVLTLQSLLPGTLVDGISLIEQPAELSYLPEESLQALTGEDAFGTWRLELWDNRVGGGTTNDTTLLNWQLNFVLAPSNAPPVIHLVHGIPYTNTLAPYAVQQFVVDVPQWATMATNVLLSAMERYTTNPVPMGVLWDLTNTAPNLTNGAVFWPPVTAVATALLTTNTNTAPYLIPGQPYYLTVTNPNPVAADFAYGVWFDMTTLTNCQSQTNFAFTAGIPRYFQFDVPTNDVPNAPPRQAIVWLSGVQSNVTVVVSEHLPLPDLAHYDYISQAPATNNEIVMVLTNSTPFPLATNRWYVGVFNTESTNVPFTIQACYTIDTNYPVLIPLADQVPFDVTFNNGNNRFLAPPGPPQWFFYKFDIKNPTAGALFELYNLSGDADLVLQRDVVPGMAPYWDGSYRTGTNAEQIVLRSSAAVPDLTGTWYLGVYNNELTNVAYSVRATLTDTNGLLLSALPMVTRIYKNPNTNGSIIQWNAVMGEYYYVQYKPDLRAPGWSNLAFMQATTPLATWNITLPGFYRISQFPAPVIAGSAPYWETFDAVNHQVGIWWPTNYPNEVVQYSTSSTGPWSLLSRPRSIVGTNYVVFDPMGPGNRFYQLYP